MSLLSLHYGPKPSAYHRNSLIIDDEECARVGLKTSHPIGNGLPSGQVSKQQRSRSGSTANQYSQAAKKYKSHKGLPSRIQVTRYESED
jgi:hypothetical protein